MVVKGSDRGSVTEGHRDPNIVSHKVSFGFLEEMMMKALNTENMICLFK